MSNIIKSRENTPAALAADFSTYIHIDSITDNIGNYQNVIADGGLTDDLQPTLNGYLPEGEALVIRVFLNGSVVGYSEVGSDGKWSYTLENPLILGTENEFQVALLDPANGNTLWLSNTYNVITTELNQDSDAPEPPTPPVIDSVVDDVKGDQGYTGELKDGDLTNDPRPALSGHAEADAVINIYDNGVLLGSTTSTADGKWTFTPDNALPDGAHGLTAAAVNSVGESAQTASFDITVDTTIIKPVIDKITDDQGAKQGSVADGGLTDDNRPVLIGHAEADSRVDIHVFGPNGKELYYQSVTAGADGSWSYQPKAFTTQGTYSFGISGVDKVGNAWYDYGDKYSIQFVGENQDAPYNSGIEQFGDADNELGYSFITAQGVEVTSRVNMVQGSAPVGFTNRLGGDTYLLTGAKDLVGEVHVKLPGIADTVTISGRSEGDLNADSVTFYNAQGNVVEVTAFTDSNYGKNLTMDVMTATAVNGEAIASFTIHNAVFVAGVKWGDPDTPTHTSGVEQFGDASNELGYSFITAQGVEVTSRVNMVQGSAPVGFTNRLGGDTYLLTGAKDLIGEVHVKLPGIADTVTISGRSEGDLNADSVTFYNAQGSVVEVTAFTDSNYGKNLTMDVMTATAVNGEAIASFTIHNAVFVAGVEWESTTTAHTMMQQVNVSDSVDNGGDAALLSQVDVTSYTDITDNQQNTLQLTLNDILSEAHDNLFIQDGNKQLAVTGDAGDVVELKVEDIAHDWQDAGQVTAGGVQYEVYQNADMNVELLVQQGMELHQVS